MGMDWDAYSQGQLDLFMKRRRDDEIARQVWDEALFDFVAMGLDCCVVVSELAND